jgi:hypothetical protein
LSSQIQALREIALLTSLSKATRLNVVKEERAARFESLHRRSGSASKGRRRFAAPSRSLLEEERRESSYVPVAFYP